LPLSHGCFWTAKVQLLSSYKASFVKKEENCALTKPNITTIASKYHKIERRFVMIFMMIYDLYNHHVTDVAVLRLYNHRIKISQNRTLICHDFYDDL
jgi:hypothetical protein